MGGEVVNTVYGLISTDFAKSALGDLCVPEGGVQTGPFGSQLHASDYVEHGTPIITVEHLGENRIIHVNLPRVTDEDKERLSRYTLQTGDIVFSRVGSVDRRAIVHPEEHGWLFSGRCLRVRPEREKIDPGYLSWFFGLPAFREYIRQIAVGATMPSLNTKILSNVVIYYPQSLKEQQAIACILGALDDKIELNRRMNETLEAMAQALFKSWFVDFDPVVVNALKAGNPIPDKFAERAAHYRENPDALGLPEHILSLFPDRFVDSELGEIPEGWGVGCVADLGEVICGKTPPTKNPENYGKDIPFVTIPDMHGKVYVTETRKSLSKKGADTQKNKYLPPNSVCVSCIATPGLVILTSKKVQTNQQINSVIPKALSPLYIYGVLHRLGDQIRAGGSGGSVFANLNKSRFSALKVLLANKDCVKAFHVVVEQLYRCILENQKESSVIANLRDTLLPKLISGELRVPDVEKILERAGV